MQKIHEGMRRQANAQANTLERSCRASNCRPAEEQLLRNSFIACALCPTNRAVIFYFAKAYACDIVCVRICSVSIAGTVAIMVACTATRVDGLSHVARLFRLPKQTMPEHMRSVVGTLIAFAMVGTMRSHFAGMSKAASSPARERRIARVRALLSERSRFILWQLNCASLCIC